MARVAENRAVFKSLMDRLSGDESAQPARTAVQSLRDLKQSVRRDLENLLNTRWRCTSFPPDLKMIEASLVNYGIPDFSGADLGNVETREAFCRVLEKSIATFEPRFLKVSVRLADALQPGDRTLRFRIDAVLRAEPSPEPVRFDSSVEPGTAAFVIGKVDR
jgi:type VI secretion system protein ImpF